MRILVQALLLTSLAFLRGGEAKASMAASAVLPLLPAVADLDLNQFNGTWYSLAEIPNAQYSTKCIRDRTITYGKSYLNFVNFVESCVVQYDDPASIKREVIGQITREKESDGGRFTARAIGNHYGAYEFVVALMPPKDYSFYAVIGNSARSMLFVQSRYRGLSESTWRYLEAEISYYKYDTSKIVITSDDDQFQGRSLSSFRQDSTVLI
jgi:lipocalin